MASLYYEASVIFLLLCSTVTSFAQENSRTRQENNNTSSINSTSCKLRIDRSKIQKVLGKHYNVTSINTVKIRVLVYQENNTEYSEEMKFPWASEVGRTIVSLIQRAEDLPILRSLFFSTILEVGTDEVDIEMREETNGCLPPRELWSEYIFNSLLHQLSHSDDTSAFRLCKAQIDETSHYTKFNCCKVLGDKTMALCTDYSPVVVDMAFPSVMVIFCISCFATVPFVLRYVITYPKTKFYKVSDSPMSLLSIALVLLFEGRGPLKSLFRRCLFAIVTYFMVFFPRFFGLEWLRWAFASWLIIFLMVDDVEMTRDEGREERQRQNGNMYEERCKLIEKSEQNSTKLEKKLIDCFKVPLALPLDWAPNLFSTQFKAWRERIKQKLENSTNYVFLWELLNNFLNVFQGLCAIFAISVSLIGYLVVVLGCLLKFVIMDVVLLFVWPHQLGFIVPLRLASFILFVFLIGMTSIFILSVIVTLTLNAEFFNPFLVPVLTLLGYFWKNWTSSVEAKCLHLKTLVIQVSLDKVKDHDDEQNSCKDCAGATYNNRPTAKDRILKFLRSHFPCISCKCGTESPEVALELKEVKKLVSSGPAKTDVDSFSTKKPETTGYNEHTRGKITEATTDITGDSGSLPSNSEEENIIKFGEYGEAMISKKIYKKIKKHVLHLDQVLFYFVRRVIFVGLYGFGMLTVMVLARESAASGIVQVISAVFAALIPFIFDTMFGDNHSSQIASEEIAMRQKLEHILKVKMQENNTILIQLVNINDDDKNAALPAESHDPLREQITFTASSTVTVNVPPGEESDQLSFESAL